MTPTDITQARADLGALWGFKRPLFASELGRALGYSNRDPGEAVRDWETGKTKPPCTAIVAIKALLAGYRP